MPIR
ncbi:hypothetical protein CGLO_13090 [Colletotrichum gloeosporioides Cg-14]|jgi:hypothetical protein